jgi:hypothetical protein
MNGEPIHVIVKELDVLTLTFNDTVERNSIKTLVSGLIMFPFNLEKVRVQFALNTNRLLRVRFFVSPDDSTPTDLNLTGHNILDPLGQVDYLCGDDEPVEIPYRALVDQTGMRVKVSAENLDSYAHTLTAQVFISRVV